MKLLAAHLALASARWASAPLSELGGVLEPFELCALRHGLTPLAAMESQWARDGGACGLSFPEILRLRGSSSPCYLNTGNKNQACALASPEAAMSCSTARARSTSAVVWPQNTDFAQTANKITSRKHDDLDQKCTKD